MAIELCFKLSENVQKISDKISNFLTRLTWNHLTFNSKKSVKKKIVLFLLTDFEIRNSRS